MSVENLKEYARRCANEPELRTQANAIGLTNLEEHMRLAETLGLDWSLDDMNAFRKEVVDADGEPETLSEEELEQVAGGAVTVVAALVVGLSVAAVGGMAVGASVMATSGGSSDW